MMKIYSLTETCSCGAKFVYEDRVAESYHSKLAEEHIRFLKAHEACRVKAVISNGKELKMFLANNTKSKEDE